MQEYPLTSHPDIRLHTTLLQLNDMAFARFRARLPLTDESLLQAKCRYEQSIQGNYP